MNKVEYEWRTYWSISPVRDKMLVENEIYPTHSRRPVRTEYYGYSVPDGTLMLACSLIFYQHYIPDGMTKHKRHFKYNITLYIYVIL